MDTFTDRRHHLMVFLEDYDRESVNKTTLHLRRILYGILFADCEDTGEVIIVKGGLHFRSRTIFHLLILQLTPQVVRICSTLPRYWVSESLGSLFTELDRVGDRLQEFEVTPIRQLWNPANRLERRGVPGLKPMETLSEIERLELFLLSMCERSNSFLTKSNCNTRLHAS